MKLLNRAAEFSDFEKKKNRLVGGRDFEAVLLKKQDGEINEDAPLFRILRGPAKGSVVGVTKAEFVGEMLNIDYDCYEHPNDKKGKPINEQLIRNAVIGILASGIYNKIENDTLNPEGIKVDGSFDGEDDPKKSTVGGRVRP
jgi:hypothetical protein